MLGIVPSYMLPSPVVVCQAFINEISFADGECQSDTAEAFLGLGCEWWRGFLMAAAMDHFAKLYQALYPLVVVTQTIPTVAIAPLLVLWFGYEMLPKVNFDCHCDNFFQSLWGF